MKRLGGTPENTIVIEDSYNGIRAAYTAGMIPVMVPDMLEADEEMHEKAETIQPCLSEVKEWIKKETIIKVAAAYFRMQQPFLFYRDNSYQLKVQIQSGEEHPCKLQTSRI